MSFQKGDFILIDYTGKIKETGDVFDTTTEDTAKKEHLYKEGEIREPKLVVIGENWVLKALDESLPTMELKKSTLVEISPEKAFGPRDPKKVKRVPLRHLTAKGTTPVIGRRIEHNGRMAVVRSIGAGRVVLDFNPPLAGKTLVYEVTVNKKLRLNKEKIAALIHRRIPVVEEDKFEFTIRQKILTIEMPQDTFYVEGVQIAKRGIAMDIQKFLPKISEVKFVETFGSEPKTETKN